MHNTLSAGWCGPLETDLLPSWIEASATGVGAVIAFGALLYVKRTWESTRGQLAEAKKQAASAEAQLALERQREDRRERAEDRAQAELVSAWVHRGSWPSVDKQQRQVRVLNQSTQPVYNFSLQFQANRRLWHRPDHPLQMKRAMLAPAVPGEGVSLWIGVDDTDMKALEEAEQNNQPFGVCFTFTDIKGKDWTRRWDGKLVEGRERFIPMAEEKPAVVG
ncbi:cupredoxin domain-containing protein [Kineosporia succinea]|uniref:Uncharacterized protein n=1 Tax=Kineosporia succinea TaxID=84632 RepID=A0ABT9NXR1_9ACTN|nr:hypothetical protein [Kineosporia succinea]MDP9825206.1 hypothetical protein [Kineosporia succinea]